MLFREAPFYGLVFASGTHFLETDDIHISNRGIICVTKLPFSR